MNSTTSTYYAIVTFGSPTLGRRASCYRSLDRAIRDAQGVHGGSCSTVRVVACATKREALDADISEPTSGGTVWQS